MKKIVIMMTAAILLCSCGGLTNITTPNSVAINQGNFKFVKTVSAETPATYVFGIGGLSRNANADVVEKLKGAAQLGPNQALADIRIQKTTKLWALGIVIKRTLTATASVIEFYDTEKEGGQHLGCQTISDNWQIEEDGSKADIVGQRSSAIISRPAVAENESRESISKRVEEIISILKKSSAEERETLSNEIADIENWYNKNEYYTWDEQKAMKTIRKLINQK
ncbi:MAG: hypothetical protein PUF62_09830 [Bacteroidales bacterium]|nr:hypothetical protein [Bacteroidales bacterium]